jgi:protein ImuB
MLACILVPLFPLAARLRSEPELKGEAVAVFEGNGNAARVIAASRRAREKGVRAGQTLPQARALLPALLARGRDRESERAAQEALLEVADTFSPRVEDTGFGEVYFDFQNPKSKIQNPKSEMEFGRSIISAVEKTGLPSRVGIGASKLAARVAANLPDSPAVVPEGEEAAFLAPLSLHRLAPELDTAATLERWGIRSIGDLAKLPEGEVASRLGELGRALHSTARGIDPRPLEPRVPPLVLTEGMDLEWPLATLEPFLFLGRAALERLVARLEFQALACTRLDVALKLDPDGHDVRSIRLPAPTRDVKTLLTLVRLDLEARPPGAPVAGFSFTAEPDQPRRAQLALFGPPALSPDRLATAIAKLAALLGADRVGSPRAVDGHRPDRFALSGYAPPPPPELARKPAAGRGLLAVRVLRPPVALEVLTDRSVAPSSSRSVDHLSRPLSLKSVDANGGPVIAGSVKIAAGPWSLEEGWWLDSPDSRSGRSARSLPEGRSPALRERERSEGSGEWSRPQPAELRSGGVARSRVSGSDGWWTEEPADRDYWDVELSDGGLYRIYRDRKAGTWFADGIYD